MRRARASFSRNGAALVPGLAKAPAPQPDVPGPTPNRPCAAAVPDLQELVAGPRRAAARSNACRRR